MDIQQRNVFGAQAVGFDGNIATHISGTNDHDPFSYLGIFRFGAAEKFQCQVSPLVSRNRQCAGFLGTGGDNDKIKIIFQPLNIFAAQRLLGMHVRNYVFDPLHFFGNDLFGNATFRNHPCNLTPKALGGFIDGNLMSALA